jgi:hypothetical protein
MINWKYKNVDLVEVPDGAFGFVYLIDFGDGKYIGRKNFFSTRKRNFGKKESALITDKRLKKYEMVTKESDWRTYRSSNTTVKDRVKNGDTYNLKIMSICFSKKELTYTEEFYLYANAVIFKDNYYNDNIAGRFYTKDAKEWEQIKK